jgi:hypothetical protein
MNERQAREKGLSFTGCYKRNKDELQERLLEFRKNGYKVYIVTEPVSQYSRSCDKSPGYSIYAEQRYFWDKSKKEINQQLDRIPAEKEYMYTKYLNDLAEIDKKKINLQERLEKIESEEKATKLCLTLK